MSRPLFLRRLLMPAILCLASSGLHAQVKMESVLPAAGGASAANATTRLAGSFGQPIIGAITTSHLNLMQGFWYAEKAPIASSIEPVAGESSPQLQCIPNPIAEEALVQASLPEAGAATFEVYDLTGKKVMALVNETGDGRDHTIRLYARELAPGDYTLVLLSNEERVSLPIRIVR